MTMTTTIAMSCFCFACSLLLLLLIFPIILGRVSERERRLLSLLNSADQRMLHAKEREKENDVESHEDEATLVSKMQAHSRDGVIGAERAMPTFKGWLLLLLLLLREVD